ncbi:MAG: hypothetical protein LC715_03005 [Gammaproteobacteria bacterium]|nr:hypothetical protein [Gammaproteobacteria bacterium]
MQSRGPVLSGELPTHEIPLYDPPVRALPERPLGLAWAVAIVVFALALLGWELYWRDFGAIPGYRNSDAAWAQQRRRIDHGEGDATVIIGSSRVLFDVQLPVWERLTGERPIQLALEGTSPVFALEDLAGDPDFTGRLLIGVTPVLFFSDFSRRVGVLPYYREQTPSQRAGQWLSTRLLEPWLAYYDPDFALFTVLKRQPWPQRRSVPPDVEVRKLSVADADRNTRMWHKVEHDPAYRALARDIWMRLLSSRPPPPPAAAIALRDKQIARAAASVAKLHARGVPVLFVRPPSAGAWAQVEQRAFARAETWDMLLLRSGAPGIHFEDHPALQGYELPEWSHLSASEADRFTAALVPIIQRDYWRDNAASTPPAQ